MLKIKKLKRNKKAQVGETVTWIVATVIIIFMLLASIFLASAYLGNFKKIHSQAFGATDIPASKSLFAYVLTEDDSGEKIYDQLKTEDNLNEFNGELGKKIF